MSGLVFSGVAVGTLLLGAGRADAVTLVDQNANTDNAGVGVANSGGNVAVGNASDNDASNTQRARSGAAGDDSVAANIGSTSNRSDGSASIHTGNATATGNHSRTGHTQAAATGGGNNNLVVADQNSNVSNAGVGVANTGFNLAVGNASTNTATNNQRARSGAAGDDSVAVNIGDTSNHSDGSASIVTGNAWAAGNISDTDVVQALATGGNGGITIADQDSDVDNAGFALANSGFNLAAGNVSVNDSDNVQNTVTGAAGDDAVAVNIGSAENSSDGSASIITGNAWAVGNWSSTDVTQALGTGGAWWNSGGVLAAGTAGGGGAAGLAGGGPSTAAATTTSGSSFGHLFRWWLFSLLGWH